MFPWHNIVAAATSAVDTVIHPLLGFIEDTLSGAVCCMISQALTSPDTWKIVYDNDTETSYIFKSLQHHTNFSEKDSRSLHASCRYPLREKRVKLLNGRIVIMNPIFSASRFLTLIVVPKNLRCIIFQAYHTTPMEVHIRRYKSLLIIRLRFFWPGMCKNIFDCLKGCSWCIPASARI